MLLSPVDESLTPFRVDIDQTEIDELQRRLAATRWPGEQTVTDWSQGVPLRDARALVTRWQHDYDWRAFEAKINAFPQFRTRIGGLGIHFLHVRSKHENALPIILSPINRRRPAGIATEPPALGPIS